MCSEDAAEFEDYAGNNMKEMLRTYCYSGSAINFHLRSAWLESRSGSMDVLTVLYGFPQSVQTNSLVAFQFGP
jgi:hypothetical protein